MNVCVLIDAWEPIWGGGQAHVWEISRRLVANYDCRIDVFTRSLIDESGKKFTKTEKFFRSKLTLRRVGPSTHFFSLFGRLIWMFTVLVAIWRNHQKQPYTLIHAHAYSAAIPGKLLNLILHIPIVFTVHGANNLELNQQNAITLIEKWLLTKIYFDREISVTKSFLRYPNVNKNIAVIPNGVNMSLFTSLRKSPAKSGFFTLLWVGRFDKVKAIDVLIKAFKKVVEVNKNVKLILIGYGYEEQSLKLLVQELRLTPYVAFVGKRKPKEIIQYYLSADIYVLPSNSEGLSISLLEAWAAKLPVIATTVGDHALLVKDKVNGFLVQPGDSTSLAATILKARSSRALKKMGVNGYNLVRTTYTWERATKQTNQVYQSLTL